MRRWLMLLLALLTAACSDSTAAVPTVTASPTLQSRTTATQTPRSIIPTASTPVPTAGPSPTPLIHVVMQGETLLGIALQYGVELGDLLLANPDVNPRFLSIGSGLIIPETGAQSAVATATPLPLALAQPSCYPDLGGGLWCLTVASAPGEQPVEAVIALITLADSDGVSLLTEPAFSPINLLAPGSVLPLAAYFTPPVPEYHASSAVLASALQASGVEDRYLQLNLTIESQSISDDQATAQVSGSVRLANPLDEPTAGARLVALALAEDGKPVGYRVWETEQAEQLASGIDFELLVASFGPPIAELAVLSEAR